MALARQHPSSTQAVRSHKARGTLTQTSPPTSSTSQASSSSTIPPVHNIIHSMTGLILHCNAFGFRDLANSTKPAGIQATLTRRTLSAGTYHDVVVILSCIERADTTAVIRNAAAHADHMIQQWHRGNTNVVVLPFAHLSSDIGAPQASLDLLTALVKELEKRCYTASLITFGSHKEWMVDVYGYPRATSWFQYRDSQ